MTLAQPNLRDFPYFSAIPKHNSFGVHTNQNSQLRKDVEADIQRLLYVGATNTLVYGDGDENPGGGIWAVEQFLANGIFPVHRVKPGQVDDGTDYAAVARKHRQRGLPGCIQIMNEPGDPREWRNYNIPNRSEVFAQNWARRANEVVQEGGWAGLQVLEEQDVINIVKILGRDNPIWARIFGVPHNYGGPHPPNYPLDPLSRIWHRSSDAPDLNDDGVLNILAFREWIWKALGIRIPLIGGEGGWLYGADSDPHRYPKVQGDVHATYTLQMQEWFRLGIFGDGKPLSEYDDILAMCHWCTAGDATGWWTAGETEGQFGYPIKTVEVMRMWHQLFPFERQWTWAPVQPPQSGGFIHNLPPFLDPRLPADLNASLETVSDPEWKIRSYVYQDEHESSGDHNFYFAVVDRHDRPIGDVPVTVDWVGREASDQPMQSRTDALGHANFPLYPSSMDPDATPPRNGPYFGWVGSDPTKSYKARGAGLPLNRHVNFLVVAEHEGQEETPVPVLTLEDAARSALPPKSEWLDVRLNAGLYNFSLIHGLGYPQTKEFPIVVDGFTFVCQVVDLAILYVLDGDWNNIKYIPKPEGMDGRAKGK